jgi:hypothetical protein
LRNLKTETTNYILQYFKKVRYRFVATATPSPNNFIELLNYAEYLGVADRGHLLTRFFKRNSTKAGDLQLNPNKKQEFWQWVSTWAVFINTPSDLGYDDTGYILPKMNLIEHCVDNTAATGNTDKYGNPAIFKEQGKGFIGQSREKRDSISDRVDRAMELIQGTTDNFIMWHHLKRTSLIFQKENINSLTQSQRLPGPDVTSRDIVTTLFLSASTTSLMISFRPFTGYSDTARQKIR